jgi:LysM repeat protein
LTGLFIGIRETSKFMAKRGREMSLSVKESRLVAVNRVGENTLQTVLQGKVELPGTAAPVERIVWVKGTPKLQSLTTDQDRVYVQGVVDLAMVYVPETLEDEPAGLKRVDWPGALPFDTHVEVIGAEPEMLAEVDMKTLACEWDLGGGQYSLDVDLIVAVTAKVEQVKDYLAIRDVNMAQGVKITTDGLMLHPVASALKLDVDKEITGILEFTEEGAAPLTTILAMTTGVQLHETEISEGKLLIKGIATLEVLYERQDLAVAVRSFPQGLPFELVYEESQIKAGMTLESRLGCASEAFVVNDGQSARVELHLQGNLLLSEERPFQVLTDIAAPGQQVEARKELVALDSIVQRKDQQVVVRGLIELPQALPPMRELLVSNAVAYVIDYEVENDKLTVEGVLDVELIYLAHSEEDTKPLFRGMFPEVIPFRQTIAVPGLELGMQPRIVIAVLGVKPDLINRETLEAAVTLRFNISVVEYVEVDVVVEAVAVEEPQDNPPTLTYIFVQSGDTIWKLSRIYHTTEAAIIGANPSLQDDPLNLKAGERLYIPRP